MSIAINWFEIPVVDFARSKKCFTKLFSIRIHPMIGTITIRPYISSDKETVLQLLQLNTPTYFSPEEENDLISYLDHEIESYFVLDLSGQVVGSGGINFSNDNTIGIISWDLLHPDFQRKSLGSKLLNYRIDLLKNNSAIRQIKVRTSQLVYPFYEKLGFKLVEVVDDYWAVGFHLYAMEYIF